MAARTKKTTEPEFVKKLGIAKDAEKYLYLVEKNGDIVRMPRGIPQAKTETIAQTGVKRERGWIYFINDDGDLVREPDKD